MDKHSKLMELLHVTDASLGESVSAGAEAPQQASSPAELTETAS